MYHSTLSIPSKTAKYVVIYDTRKMIGIKIYHESVKAKKELTVNRSIIIKVAITMRIRFGITVIKLNAFCFCLCGVSFLRDKDGSLNENLDLFAMLLV